MWGVPRVFVRAPRPEGCLVFVPAMFFVFERAQCAGGGLAMRAMRVRLWPTVTFNGTARTLAFAVAFARRAASAPASSALCFVLQLSFLGFFWLAFCFLVFKTRASGVTCEPMRKREVSMPLEFFASLFYWSRADMATETFLLFSQSRKRQASSLQPPSISHPADATPR